MNDRRVVDFSNRFMRPTVDQLMSAVLTTKRFLQVVAANQIKEICNAVADKSQAIEDGSPEDGRNPQSVLGLLTLIAMLETLDAQLDTPDDTGWSAIRRADYLSVNPRSVI